MKRSELWGCQIKDASQHAITTCLSLKKEDLKKKKSGTAERRQNLSIGVIIRGHRKIQRKRKWDEKEAQEAERKAHKVRKKTCKRVAAVGRCRWRARKSMWTKRRGEEREEGGGWIEEEGDLWHATGGGG